MIETDGLRLRIWRDDDSTTELEAVARSQGYSGVGRAWFDLGDLATFADALASFPLNEQARRGIAGGYCGSSTQGELDQVHVAISACQIDQEGHVAVQVRMAMHVDHDARPESQQTTQIEFRTTYAELARFAGAVRRLISGEGKEAFLPADNC